MNGDISEFYFPLKYFTKIKEIHGKTDMVWNRYLFWLIAQIRKNVSKTQNGWKLKQKFIENNYWNFEKIKQLILKYIKLYFLEGNMKQKRKKTV